MKYFEIFQERDTVTLADREKVHLEVGDMMTSMGGRPLELYVEKKINEQLVKLFESYHQCDNKKEFDGPDFCLEIKDSNIPGAGRGVFVKAKRKVHPGTVMALYPGVINFDSRAADDVAYRRTLEPDDNLQVHWRLDGLSIDGRREGLSQVPYNPYGWGHMINHCGKDLFPNVQQVTFDFPEDPDEEDEQNKRFPTHLRQYVPNVWAKPVDWWRKPEQRMTFMRTTAFIALQPLVDGQELLMDYRLNPDAPSLPSWYTHHNEEEARNVRRDYTERVFEQMDREEKVNESKNSEKGL